MPQKNDLKKKSSDLEAVEIGNPVSKKPPGMGLNLSKVDNTKT